MSLRHGPTCLRIGLLGLTYLVCAIWIGCSDGDDASKQKTCSVDMLDVWFPDIRASKRLDYYKACLEDARAQFSSLAQSRHMAIAANAVPALEMLRATERDEWSQIPIAIYAIMVLSENEELQRRDAMLLTKVCDLSRYASALVFTARSRGGRRPLVRIEITGTCGAEGQTFVMASQFAVRFVDVDSLAGDAPQEGNGCLIVRYERRGREGTVIAMPDPRVCEMQFSYMNKVNRTSNAVGFVVEEERRRSHGDTLPGLDR